ncbi:MAG: amino acid transporter, partial [Bacteroidia bacterium]|nr:amino acid transporter [Bacteroidia bacterium]
AFILVCAGVLRLQMMPNPPERKFKTPYINSRFITPSLFILTFILLYIYIPGWLSGFFSYGEWETFKHKIPLLLFFGVFAYVSYLSYVKNMSLIPVLGLLSCLYLMSELGIVNWLRFFIWLGIGMVIYFTYSYKHSKLNKK